MSTQIHISLDTIDKINSSLAKAIAIANLLSTDGQDIKSGFKCNHSIIMDAIWDISDQLNAIKTELRGK